MKKQSFLIITLIFIFCNAYTQTVNPTIDKQKLSQIDFLIENPEIKEVLKKYMDSSFLKIGEIFDYSHFRHERERINQLVKNKFTDTFSITNVEFLIDVDEKNYQVVIKIDFDPPNF